MRVRSVNVGRRETVELRGKSVETGLFKAPVEGVVQVRRDGLEGDTFVTARKGGRLEQAVYAYATEHLRFWEGRFGLQSIAPGRFGENLTVDGATDDTVRIGDTWRCGTALLQVAQPRLPCRKLDLAFERPFLREFLHSLRLGPYLRVLEPGEVRAGDRVTVESSDPTAPTLETFSRLTQVDYWDAEGLRGLLRAPGLAAAWQEAITDKVERASAAEGWLGTRPLVVTDDREEAAGVHSFGLRCVAGKALPKVRSGAVLHLVSEADGGNAFSRLACVLVGDPRDTSSYRIALRTRSTPGVSIGGRVASYLPRTPAVGDVLRATAPRDLLSLPPGDDVAFLTEGLGCACVRAWLLEHADRGDARPVRWLHCDINGSTMPFQADFKRFRAEARLAPVLHFRHPLPADVRGMDFDATGWPGADAVLDWLQPSSSRTLVVAGTETFVETHLATLRSAGVPESLLRTMPFGSGTAEALDGEPEGEPGA